MMNMSVLKKRSISLEMKNLGKKPSEICIWYLEDSTEEHEVMWRLLHFLEHVDPVNQILVKSIEKMVPKSKEWVMIFIRRILNTPVARMNFKRNYERADRKTKVIIRLLLQEIGESNSKFKGNIDFILS
ncbi:Imm30 family immunity protein [Thermoactinomyces sp. CICC 10522]|uniref:Imm30 family immunity protein n=1 Tax=Thermoactinomyces sp. CICC 10522 TaxID=2767427 RepID=UPI0018DEBCB9|nr:Imm30 family immunity protein [Thermoactinomyces sp. CICC 10522]MBH8605836.1 hypothetical protein [Thermoactinomyces sp. CICC 10522]